MLDRPKRFNNESILDWISEHGKIIDHGFGDFDTCESYCAPHSSSDYLSRRYDVSYSNPSLPEGEEVLVLRLLTEERRQHENGGDYALAKIYTVHNTSKSSRKILFSWFGGDDDRLKVTRGYHGTYVSIPSNLQ